ncbi:MAG TPA: chromate resistance protein ChrB domain-containing protein [Thermoanaerobaculia bacterium]|nr:chromate resistance protein ChrB domain-containing protein [Thermoanaerobaculia bacterium]
MSSWLVLIHQLPPEPSYLRVKVARRLERIGAVQIKNTVYVLPATAQCKEDLQWTMAEIREGGGEVNLFESKFLDGISDADVEQRFKDERDADYDALIAEIKGAGRRARGADGVRFRRRLAAIQAIDFFAAPRGPAAAALLEEKHEATAADLRAEDFRGRTWVTRPGVHVDRMASAWLIRRFIDPKAKIACAPRPAPRALTFDMPNADFTHDATRCTFEVLRDRFGLADKALRPLGEIVHDIDLKDDAFGHDETAGVAALVAGIALGHRDDKERLARAAQLFDELYEFFRRKR